MPAAAEDDSDMASNVRVSSGHTVMTFDIPMHQSDTTSLGVTVHVSSSSSTLQHLLSHTHTHTHTGQTKLTIS